MHLITLVIFLLLTSSALAAKPKVHRGLAYAEPKNERQTLDVYAPSEGKYHPVVVWIHGGGWQAGDKTEVQKKPQAFTAKGFVFISINYRLLPKVTIKQMARDVAKAIRWAHNHAKDYGGDPTTLFVMGHSAGAQLAALLCTDERYLKAQKLPLSIIKGCVPVDGDTYDVPLQIRTVEKKRGERYRMKFGAAASQRDLSPVTHVAKGKNIPPFLILHVADHPETNAQSQRLAKALQAAGISAKAFPAKGKTHDTINADLGLPADMPTRALFDFLDGVNRAAKPRKKHRGKFTVGKETTYVTGPLDKDGYIDYAAALNQRVGRGVTPANNANVLIWQALGPHPDGETMPPEFFRLMGIKEPPPRGDYYLDLQGYVKDRLKMDPRIWADRFSERLEHLAKHPWTRGYDSALAAWLKANEKPLALIIEGSKRSQYFSPTVPARTKRGPSGLIGARIPAVRKCRELAMALAARGMLHLGQKEYDHAWQDLLACHRLGRLVGRGSSPIEGLVGIATGRVASKASLAFLDSAKPNAKRIKSCLRDLQKLPSLPEMADIVDLFERFMLLDVFMRIDRHGIQGFANLASHRPPEKPNPVIEVALQGIDWDPALRDTNRWYNRLVTAMQEKDHRAREKKLVQIREDLSTLKQTVESSNELGKIRQSVQQPAKVRGKVLGDLYISLMMPAFTKLQHAADRNQQLQDNILLAFALAWYQRDHGHYPKKLEALAPKYLAQVPRDLFSGKPLIYRPAGNGYLLYSVGVNGKDEGGRGSDDEPTSDDLSVRMPLPGVPHK
jgi:acetyl esterase/lipase